MLLKLAFRNILRQRRRALLTGLSMSGGYLLCALSISLSEGSYNNIINLFTLDHTGHIQIHKDDYLSRPKNYKTLDNLHQLSQTLDNHPAIQHHTLRVFTPALAYSEKGNTPARVIGVDLFREQQTSRLFQKVTQGSYISSTANAEGMFSAMIGAGIASSLKVGLGDELILISQGADGSVANDIFVVDAIIGNKKSPDKQSIFLSLGVAQEFINVPGKVHEVSIRLKDGSQARQMASKLQKILGPVTVSPWQLVEETFYKSMQSDKKGNQVILGIIIFIVFIGVLNTVLMSVMERTREFGVLKAIGSKPGAIMLLISLETSILAMLSILAGFLVSIPFIAWFAFVGIALTEPVNLGGVFFSHITGEFSTIVFLSPALAILAFAALISVPPGIRAAKISPTDAMRNH